MEDDQKVLWQNDYLFDIQKIKIKFILIAINAEYDIKLTALERILEDRRSRRSDYWVRIENVQKSMGIYSY